MPDIPRTNRPCQSEDAPAFCPWVVRAAAMLLVDGPEAIALLERDTDEVIAILAAAIGLVEARRRPRR
jgi:hypothetical protein